MATADFNASDTVSALPGITAGTYYAIQNVSGDIARLSVAVDEPEIDSPAFAIAPGGDVSLKADSGESIWVWTGVGRNALVVYDASD